MVDLTNVESGLACNCQCPSCGQALLAKKGNVRQHHFSHKPGDNLKPCQGALETSIHLMAKQIILFHKSFVLPELIVTRARRDNDAQLHEVSESVEKEGEISFESVELEVFFTGFRPDIVCNTDGRLLAIEVAVTHRSDSEKIRRLRSAKIATVELDLSHVSMPCSEADLTNLIIHSAKNRKWLSNPKVPFVQRMLDARLEQSVREANVKILARRALAKSNDKCNSDPDIKLTSDSCDRETVRHRTDQMRWFRCENCKATFPKSIEEVGLFVAFVPCKTCGFEVSTATLSLLL